MIYKSRRGRGTCPLAIEKSYRIQIQFLDDADFNLSAALESQCQSSSSVGAKNINHCGANDTHSASIRFKHASSQKV